MSRFFNLIIFVGILCTYEAANGTNPLKVLVADTGGCQILENHKPTLLQEAVIKEYGKDAFVDVKLGDGTPQAMTKGTLYDQVDYFDVAIQELIKNKVLRSDEKYLCVTPTQNFLTALGYIQSLCPSNGGPYGIVSVGGLVKGCSKIPGNYRQLAEKIFENSPSLVKITISKLLSVLDYCDPHSRTAAWIIFSETLQKNGGPFFNFWKSPYYYADYSLGLPYLLNEKKVVDELYLPYSNREILYNPLQQKKNLQQVRSIHFITSTKINAQNGMEDMTEQDEDELCSKLGMINKKRDLKKDDTSSEENGNGSTDENSGDEAGSGDENSSEKSGDEHNGGIKISCEATFETVNFSESCHHTEQMTKVIMASLKNMQEKWQSEQEEKKQELSK